MFGFWKGRFWHGYGPGWPMPPFFHTGELELLKNYKQNLEFYKKQLEQEIAAVDDRIKNLEQ